MEAIVEILVIGALCVSYLFGYWMGRRRHLSAQAEAPQERGESDGDEWPLCSHPQEERKPGFSEVQWCGKCGETIWSSPPWASKTLPPSSVPFGPPGDAQKPSASPDASQD